MTTGLFRTKRLVSENISWHSTWFLKVYECVGNHVETLQLKKLCQTDTLNHLKKFAIQIYEVKHPDLWVK